MVLDIQVLLSELDADIGPLLWKTVMNYIYGCFLQEQTVTVQSYLNCVVSTIWCVIVALESFGLR
jgi:hypothetical protein